MGLDIEVFIIYGYKISLSEVFDKGLINDNILEYDIYEKGKHG